MTLNFGQGLFPGGFDFDDNNYLLTNAIGIFRNAKVTFSFGGSASGNQIPLYDGVESTFMTLQAGATTGTVTWEFDRKERFKQVQISVHIDWATAGNINATISGSNDGSSWTELTTKEYTADADETLTADDVNYKYIKVTLTGDNASHASGISDVRGAQ